MNIKPYLWGTMPDGRSVTCYPLSRGNIKAQILNLGGIVYSLDVPDKDGKYTDVMLGFDTPQEYLNSDTYFGAIVGRYANRIENGIFELNGKTYQLEINNGKNNLHSGKNGFHQYLFDAEFDESKPHRLILRGENPGVKKELDGKTDDNTPYSQGFPGDVKITVIYELTEDNGLNITYEATTKEETPMNMTWHGYFNLDGHDAGNILEHRMQMNADKYTPFKDENMIPSGEIVDVEGTPFDFRQPKTIGRDIAEEHVQLQIGGGYDHNMVFSLKEAPNKDVANKEVAKVKAAQSGIVMTVHTDRPCMQFYTGNFIVTQKGKKDVTYNHRQGFCMETQTYPNAVNSKTFPSDILKPGEVYKASTRYKFYVE